MSNGDGPLDGQRDEETPGPALGRRDLMRSAAVSGVGLAGLPALADRAGADEDPPLLFEDDFEDGDLSKWREVKYGTGRDYRPFYVTSAPGRSGYCGAHANSSRYITPAEDLELDPPIRFRMDVRVQFVSGLALKLIGGENDASCGVTLRHNYNGRIFRMSASDDDGTFDRARNDGVFSSGRWETVELLVEEDGTITTTVLSSGQSLTIHAPEDALTGVTIAIDSYTFRGDRAYFDNVRVSAVDGSEPTPPSVSATGDAVDEGSAATVSAEFTDPDEGLDHTATIDWGDDQSESVPVDETPGGGALEASHTYVEDGTYEATVTVTDEEGASGEATATVEVANVAPTVSATGDSIDEGSQATVAATFTDPGVLDTHTATVDWDDGTEETVAVDQGEGEGSIEASHRYLDDGEYEATVTVTDDDGDAGTATATVDVANVAPTVTATGDSIDEGSEATVAATFTDPGVLDTHTAEIDWGEGTVESVPVDQGEGEGSLAATHVYGDDGDYEVTVSVTDDDGGTGTDTVTVDVANLPPAASLDTSDAVTLPSGERAFLGTVDVARSHSARATDPGSDDLTFAWSFGAETTYYNDGEDADPDGSPGGTFPFSASDTASVTVSSPGIEDVEVTVSDDDGASDAGGLPELVRGTAGDTRGIGFWGKEYGGRGRPRHSDATLAAFLSMTDFSAGAFGDGATGSFDAAADTLHPRGPAMRDKAEAHALAAWLNFAAGGVDWTDPIDVDGDGTGDRPFHDVIAEIDAILGDGDASRSDLERAKDLAEAVNEGGDEGGGGDGDDDDGGRGGDDDGNERDGNGRGSGRKGKRGGR